METAEGTLFLIYIYTFRQYKIPKEDFLKSAAKYN